MHPGVAEGHAHVAELGRRGFLSLMIGWSVGEALPSMVTGRGQPLAGAQAAEYVIVNGWVLTREDVAGAGTMLDVV